MIIVSNSQATSFNLCKRQHSYQFLEDLEPANLPKPFDRGVLGHASLAVFYQAVKNGDLVEDAKKASKDFLIKESVFSMEKNEVERVNWITLEMLPLISRYLDFYALSDSRSFKILEVEKEYYIDYGLDISLGYGMRLDLLVELQRGVNRGDIVLIDHKFCYNFKSQNELNLDGQGPKYVRCLRLNDIPVRHMWFNQVRYRKIKDPREDQIFQRTVSVLNKRDMDTVWAEQFDTAMEISQGEYNRYRRTLSPIVCKTCLYADLCKAERTGQDTGLMRKVHFRPRTYGYSSQEIDVDLHG